MWKIVKAWSLFWWRVWLAGPPTKPYITADNFEASVEKACRRVLAAHAARLAEARDATPVLIHFVNENEDAFHGDRSLPSWQRSPVLSFNNQTYRAARFDDGKKAWIYRLVR